MKLSRARALVLSSSLFFSGATFVVASCGDNTLHPPPADTDLAHEAGSRSDGSVVTEAGPHLDAAPPEAGDAGDAAYDGPVFPWDGAVLANATVTYQIDPAHTGALPSGTLTLPLAKRWTRDFGGEVSYPLVAGGRVFVIVGNRSGTSDAGSFNTALFSLDAASGNIAWGPISLGKTYWWAAAAYDDGKIFTIDFDGKLSAFDADKGTALWEKQMPGQYAFSSPPTAAGGMVFVGGAGSGGTVYGVEQANGQVLWQVPVENGDHSSPALDPGNVYVSYACNQAYRIARTNGAVAWHHTADCEGGGGKTVALLGNSVYTRDSTRGNLILSIDTGTQTGTHGSNLIPAGAGGVGYFTVDAGLQASPLTGTNVNWRFTPDADAGETLSTAPIVVGPYVVVGTSSTLYVLNVSDGKVASSDTLAEIRVPDEQNVSAPIAGLGAGGGMLFVPAGTTLVAY
jgi:outer membrane protein assembly factor BamB